MSKIGAKTLIDCPYGLTEPDGSLCPRCEHFETEDCNAQGGIREKFEEARQKGEKRTGYHKTKAGKRF